MPLESKVNVWPINSFSVVFSIDRVLTENFFISVDLCKYVRYKVLDS